jgi:hypothetical protein
VNESVGQRHETCGYECVGVSSCVPSAKSVQSAELRIFVPFVSFCSTETSPERDPQIAQMTQSRKISKRSHATDWLTFLRAFAALREDLPPCWNPCAFLPNEPTSCGSQISGSQIVTRTAVTDRRYRNLRNEPMRSPRQFKVIEKYETKPFRLFVPFVSLWFKKLPNEPNGEIRKKAETRNACSYGSCGKITKRTHPA